MLDIAAFPIVVALTLWDAVPVYLSVGLALSIIASTLVPRQAFHKAWALRESIGIEGVVYLALFDSRLIPVLAVASILRAIGTRRANDSAVEPRSQVSAIVVRANELIHPLLVASATAALIKLFAPQIPDAFGLELVVAGITGIVVGNRSGTIAIPTIAIASHLGGLLPASICIAASISRPYLGQLPAYVASRSTTRR